MTAGRSMEFIKGSAHTLKRLLCRPIVKYTFKRIALALLTVFAVITVTFFVMHAVPGGPFLAEKAISEEAQAELMEKYGLDKPIIIQYLTYIKDVATKLDFGPSLKQRGRTVSRIISDGLRVSAGVGICAAAVAILIGPALGAIAATKKGQMADKIIMVATTAFVSAPSFIIGTILLYVFSTKLGWLPASGSAAGISGYILPAVTLSLYPTAYITRLMRSSLLDTIGQDYVRTALAKGLSQTRILFTHAMKNALAPVITYIGPMIAGIITGSLVIERIFAIPGIGRAFVGSITYRDYPLIMGTTITLAVIVVVMNLVCDLLYKIADPRIRLE